MNTRFKLLKKMERNGRTKRQVIGPSFFKERKAKGAEWIETLSVDYSYRNNNKVVDETATYIEEIIGSKFLPLECKFPRTRQINILYKTAVISAKKVHSNFRYLDEPCTNINFIFR